MKIVYMSVSLPLLILLIASISAAEQPQLQYSEFEEIVCLGGNRYRVTAEERVIHITREEARQKAINQARVKAVETCIGIKVNSHLLNFQGEIDATTTREFFSNITQMTSQGIITEQKVVDEMVHIVDNDPVVRVTVELEVGIQEGSRDPDFFFRESELNKRVFNEGDRLVLTLTPSKDCYITVINIYSDETASMVYPNIISRDNFARADKPHQIPPANSGYSFSVNLRDSLKRDSESLLIIATKQPYDFSAFDHLSEYNTYETTLTKIMKQLVEIPLSDITDTFLEYVIYSN